MIVPLDVRAEMAQGLDVEANGVVDRPFHPMELHAGTLLLDVSTGGPASIRFRQGGRVVSHWTRGSTMGGGGGFQADDSIYPTAAQQHAAPRGGPWHR